jgi:iron complex transport system ATP-binding protein
MSRIVPKTEGCVYVDNKELQQWNNNELSKRISILKQSNHLNIRLTVRELISFGRFPYSKGRLTKKDNEIIDKALSFLSLENIQHRNIDELSGGQRQMAYIAMIIAQDTEYVFLDEPLNNLDMRHSVQIMKGLRKLVDEMNKTIMVVIHDINFIAYYSDYIIAMKDGKVVSQGYTDEIITKEVLKEIYGMDIDVQSVNGKPICLYYN